MAKRKPGKYDHLFPKLQKLPPQDLEHQQRVEDTKKLLRQCEKCAGNGTLDVPKNIEEMTRTNVYADGRCVFCEGTGRRTLNAQTLASLYVTSRADKETLEQMVKDANLVVEAVTQMLIASQENGDPEWGAFGASDRAIKLTNGDSLRVQPEVFALPRKKDEFQEWCFSHGLRNKMELPEKATLDLAKSRLLNGDKEADGLEIYVRTRVVYTPMKTEVQTSDSNNETQEPAELDVF